MADRKTLDKLVRDRLRQWPQYPPGLNRRAGGARGGAATPPLTWLRGRPCEDMGSCHPFLKLPGSTRLRTLPDGLWLNFGGTPVDPFVDIFAVEACGSLQNLLDKRSRFAPSTHSLLAVCPVPWLLAPVGPADSTPRWQATGVLRAGPVLPLVLPVRDMRVMYGPPPPCKGFRTTMTDPALAVVYPALSRGSTAAGPDGIRGSAARQMDELVAARIVSLTFAEPGQTGSPSSCVTLASQRHSRRRRPGYAAAATTAGRRYVSARVSIAHNARAVLYQPA